VGLWLLRREWSMRPVRQETPHLRPFESDCSCLIPKRPRLALFAPWGCIVPDGTTET
jgi:hypothetical protein